MDPLRALAAPLALLALLLAGCADGADPPRATQAPGDAAPATGPKPPPAGAAEPHSFAVAFDGSLQPRACVPAGTGACVGIVATSEANTYQEALGGAHTWDGELRLTWETPDPTMRRLEAYAYAHESCGEGCWHSTSDVLRFEGESPLALPVRGLAAGPGSDGFTVYVTVPSTFPSPLYGYVNSGVAFRIEGTLTATPTPPA